MYHILLVMYNRDTPYPQEAETQTHLKPKEEISNPYKTIEGNRRLAWMEPEESRNTKARETGALVTSDTKR